MMNYDYVSRQQNNNLGKSGSERHDSYDGHLQQHYDQPAHQARHADDRSHSGHRAQPASVNNYMPPRYPQTNQQPNRGENRHTFGPQNRGPASQDGGFQSYLYSPKNPNQFPKGGTGATDDSFASSLKQQAYSHAGFGAGGNPNFSSMALTANSFHQMADTSSNSFDALASGPNNRGAPATSFQQSFTNTATDWNNAGHRAAYLEMGAGIADTVSETRSNNLTSEFSKLNNKYHGHDDSSLGRQPHSYQYDQQSYDVYSNKKPQTQLDRFEDDDQRSPERRAPRIIVDPATASPDRYHNDFRGGVQPNDQRYGQPKTAFEVHQQQHPQNNYSPSRQQKAYHQHQAPPQHSNVSTLSDLLHQSRTSSQNHVQQQQVQQATWNSKGASGNSSALFPSKQTSAPQKSRKNGKKRTILDQKESWKIRTTRCYMGPDLPQIHYSQNTLTWQQAIAKIEDLGIDMTAHKKVDDQWAGNQETSKLGYDFDQASNPAAKSDGFKNWGGPAKSQKMQTDFYQQHKRQANDMGADEDLAAQPLNPKKQSQTQNNFFKISNNRLEDENVSTDSLHEKRNDLLENFGYSKSPSGNAKKVSMTPTRDDDQEYPQQQRSPHFQTVEDQPAPTQGHNMGLINRDQLETDAIQTLKNLRYSDLIYLLNILKLQRSKNADHLKARNASEMTWEEAREQWVTDLQLALSVAISAEDRDKKDTNAMARVIIEKIEACRTDKFTASLDQDAGMKDLQYEHFIGPLVVLCAIDNLLRAQGSNNGDSECISTIKLCFDQFERYYAKAVTTAAQRRSNSMSGSTFPAQRMDSYEVQPECFKNFTVSLKTFIDRETLPCKSQLKQALETMTLDKVQSNHLVFPQGSQLILSQLNRLFGIHLGGSGSNGTQQQREQQPMYDPLDQQQKETTQNSPRRQQADYQQHGLYSKQGSQVSQKCEKHGITFCPCSGQEVGRGGLMASLANDKNEGGRDGSVGVSQKHQRAIMKNDESSGQAKPQHTLKAQFSNESNQAQSNYYQKTQPVQERRQHSMVDFSASRRVKTSENNYISNQDNLSQMAGEYRPFSTIISNKDDEEVVRPSIYGGQTNQPMSLELEHKRSVQTSSKSVQKPKKGILKTSSSYLDQSNKKQPVHFNSKHVQSVGKHPKTTATTSSHSPYSALNKHKNKVLKHAQTYPERGSGSSKKQGTLRYESNKNLLSVLGQSDEPPKFHHAATTKNIFSPQNVITSDNHERTGLQTSQNSNKRSKQTMGKGLLPNNGQNATMQINSLASILRTGGSNMTPQNQRLGDENQRQSPSRLTNKYGQNPSNHGHASQLGNDGSYTSSSHNNLTLTATSMKYLRNAPSHQSSQTGAFSQKSGSTAHSNVLLKAQNLQNRNDSFAMQSSYSLQHNQPSSQGGQPTLNPKIASLYRPSSSQTPQQQQQPGNHTSQMISQLMSPQPTSQPNNHHRLQGQRDSHQSSPVRGNGGFGNQGAGNGLHQSPQRTSLLGSAKRSNSYQGGSSGQQSGSLLQSQYRLSGSGGFNQLHPRISSARKEMPTDNSFGIMSGSHAGMRSSELAAKAAGAMATHTDFNHVSQFSLSSLKDKDNGTKGNTNAATTASNKRYH